MRFRIVPYNYRNSNLDLVSSANNLHLDLILDNVCAFSPIVLSKLSCPNGHNTELTLHIITECLVLIKTIVVISISIRLHLSFNAISYILFLIFEILHIDTLISSFQLRNTFQYYLVPLIRPWEAGRRDFDWRNRTYESTFHIWMW